MRAEFVSQGIEAAISSGGTHRVRCLGGSMWPLITSGLSIWIGKVDGDDVRVGDVVLTLHDNQLLLHRVRRLADRRFQTQGDNRRKSDPWLPVDKAIGRAKGLLLYRWQWRGAPRLLVQLHGVLCIALSPFFPVLHSVARRMLRLFRR